MRDQFQGDAVGARKTDGQAARQQRQFAAVRGRQQTPDRADLLFDQVEIVQQPFGGRFDTAVLSVGRRHQIIRLDQHPLVLVQSRQQFVASSPHSQLVRRRDRLGMPFQLIDAEQFRSQRLFVRGLAPRGISSAGPPPGLQPQQLFRDVRNRHCKLLAAKNDGMAFRRARMLSPLSTSASVLTHSVPRNYPFSAGGAATAGLPPEKSISSRILLRTRLSVAPEISLTGTRTL